MNSVVTMLRHTALAQNKFTTILLLLFSLSSATKSAWTVEQWALMLRAMRSISEGE